MEEWERLLEELRAEFLLREEELELLHTIDLLLLESERPVEATFSYIVEKTGELLKSDHTHLLLRRGSFLEPVYTGVTVDMAQRIDVHRSLTGQCLIENKIVNIPDVVTDGWSNRYVPIQGYDGAPMRSLLASPIRVNDTTIGVLNAESTRVGAFRSVHERISAAIAAQIGIVLQRAQHFDRAALFADVDQLIFAAYDRHDSHQVIPAALARVMQELHELEHVRLSGAQILFRKGREQLEIVHSTNPSDVGLVVAIDESISGRAVQTRKTVTIGDVRNEPKYRRMLGDNIQSEIAVPILLGDEQVVIGVLNVESEELDAFSGFYQVVLESFADKVRTLLAFAKLRTDVTDVLELRSASDLLVAVGDQTSHMIHRLNNTVGAMRVRIIELLEMQKNGELDDDSYLSSSLEALLQLADRTLEMPRDVTQLLSQEGSTVSVNECVQAALNEFQIPDNIKLDIQLGSDIPALPLYSFDIVVQNLIQNALDAMSDGGTLSISTSLTFHEELLTGYVELVVADTGIGMPDDLLGKIFELNFTTKSEKGKGKGLGLGLWWVRNFVRRAQGEITIASTINVGSNVVVKIPVDRTGAEEV
jgi:signal transduction histidine kinase